ncbi:hypothetical protein [Salsipaludibacter albus]|uniref:hypothetical protein n=1 Tax=Salsipaludibacter albus TaxID=2849650 RepID=UPI001EE4CC9F|nr:hypothetical protein [Salsipaludibacter albus]MBY5163281.1 hypothetical protein [Salsipaludibacter albus]
MTIPVSDPSTDELAAMLRAGATGHVPTEAAVELIIRHGGWPPRLLANGHVDTWPATHDQPAMASVDWDAVADRLADHGAQGPAASSSERAILAVATSLAGRHDINLGDLLPRLDATNAGLVAGAVGHACNSGIRVAIHRPPPAPSIHDLLTRTTSPQPSPPETTRRGGLRP